MEASSRLREDLVDGQAVSFRRALTMRRRNLINGALAGGIAGVVGTALSAAITDAAIAWHSFLLEALFCTLAGYVLVRRGGGILTGALLFAIAYVAAFQLRAHGFDLGVLMDVGDLRRAAAAQGHVMALCILMACGGAFGSILEH